MNNKKKAYETRFGIPEQLAQLEDVIFEWLPNEEAMLWPERFLSAFEVGKDYSKVWNHFAVWLLADPDEGVIRFADKEGKAAIKNVVKLHKKVIKGTRPRQSTWEADAAAARAASAASAARYAASAAAEAAWAAGGGAAASAARYAAEATWAAAWAAGGDAAAARAASAARYAASAARHAAYQRMANKLIELIGEVK